MKTIFLLLTISGALPAQQTVAPTTDEPVGPARGENRGTYNIVQSWELGYRLASVGGNEGVYRSDVNYRNGIRLLGSSLTVNSRDGHGRFFDEIVLTTQGLGNDPYESATLRVQKNRVYQYNLLWRENDYYNPALTVASGEHLMDTKHRWQDHDLLLFPQAKVRVKAGYSRVGQAGPALTTELLFDTRGDVIPLFRNIRREYNEYRVGADVDLAGFRFSFLRRWEFFKEDTADSLGTTVQVGNTALTSFGRGEPNHGYTSSWMGNLFADKKWIVMNAHVTYSGGSKDFILGENAIGTDRIGSQNRQVYVSGNGSRPFLTGDLNLTFLAGPRWTILNNTSVSNLRISGDNLYQQYDVSSGLFNTLNFQFLGIRLITNSTDARFRVNKTFDVFGGFRYSDRLIRSDEASATLQFPFDSSYYEQTNTMKVGSAGFNWLPLHSPVHSLRIHLEGEMGRNDNPFTPISEKNYHAIKGRVMYRTRTVTAGVSYTENYNNNSIAITSYSSHSRNYSAEAGWAVRPWLSFDGSYSKLHLDTAGGIAFFAGTTRSQLQTGNESIYISNTHALNVSARFAMKKRADLFVGYSLTRDAGDGRSSLLPQATDVQQALYNVQTFPLSYQSPFARLSVPLRSKLRWNLGYQWYGYSEKFGVLAAYQNFRAHTGFTSLLWAF